MAIRKNILPIIISSVFLLISLYSFVDNILYRVSRNVAMAKIIKIEKLDSPNPYKVLLTYYNKYTKSFQTTYIDDIDTDFGDNLRLFQQEKIFYRNYFPKEIYFINYKSPTLGYIFLSFIFLVLMIVGVVALIVE